MHRKSSYRVDLADDDGKVYHSEYCLTKRELDKYILLTNGDTELRLLVHKKEGKFFVFDKEVDKNA